MIRRHRRLMRLLFPSIIAALASSASVALASSSSWHTMEGARLRIVTAGAPDKSGVIRGMLQIDLKPGWKTYWRDPGASGVPPSVDISGSTNVESAVVSYPAPMRFDDESGPWNGYKHSVALPVSFRLAEPGAPAAITAEVFVGVCETVCVPVQATLSVDPAQDPDNFDDAIAIKRAVAALPADAQPEFGATLLSSDKDKLEISVAFKGDRDTVDLFVAGVDGYTLGVPEKTVAGDAMAFRIPILERPQNNPSGKGLPYTLVTKAGALDGFIPYP